MTHYSRALGLQLLGAGAIFGVCSFLAVGFALSDSWFLALISGFAAVIAYLLGLDAHRDLRSARDLRLTEDGE